MDLSKAFDCIPYDLLLAKLFDENSLNHLKSYLFGRKQRVKLNSVYSSYVNVDRGIPQGSILGPLLFNIFLNDLLLDFKTTEICNFADDSSLYKGNKNLQFLNDILSVTIDCNRTFKNHISNLRTFYLYKERIALHCKCQL